MKLWLIHQSKDNDYDTCDEAVVSAETEEEARAMHPEIGDRVKVEDIRCEYLGEAKEGTQKEVICAAVNAG